METISRSPQALVRRGTIPIVDSANFRILRREDLFRIAGQNEDLVEMVRRRTPASKHPPSHSEDPPGTFWPAFEAIAAE